MKSRIGVPGYWTLYLEKDELPVLHVYDFWRFGYTKDLLRYFDITERSSWNGGAGWENLESAETSFIRVWMRDMRIKDVESIPELTGRYLTIIELEQLWFRSHSHIAEIETLESRYRTTEKQWRTFVEEQEKINNHSSSPRS